MPDPNSERDANKAIVDAARTVLREAAQNLTPEIEPAAIYSIAPHPLAEEPAGEEQL